MTRRPSVVVLDYGSGNIRSAERALVRAGADVTVSSDAALAGSAAGVVVPGVGAFAECMRGLRRVGGPSIVASRLFAGKPVFGICVGHQVMFARGDENGLVAKGIGVWPGDVSRLDADVLPHVGWNTVEPADDTDMFAGIAGERFYFVHSYAAHHAPVGPMSCLERARAAWTAYGNDRFVAAIEDGPLWSTQFHPEKSGDAGITLLTNWVRRL